MSPRSDDLRDGPRSADWRARPRIRRSRAGFAALAALGLSSIAVVSVACRDRSTTPEVVVTSTPAVPGQEAASVPALPVEGAEVPVRRAAVEQAFVLMDPKDGPRMIQWFGGVPANVRASSVDPGAESNIRRADYAGPESCAECHPRNYRQWSEHAHRWMNAWANDETVKGDFSGEATIRYMGGVGRFHREDGQYRMALERDGVRREFAIRRTIGSRFFQYYVGRLLDGPEGPEHELRYRDHVLPFGYWLEASEWVPIVNVGKGESPDAERQDPFADPGGHRYDAECSVCHTTRPTGDTLLWSDFGARMDRHSPRKIHFSTEAYLHEEHPSLVAPLVGSEQLTYDQIVETLKAAMLGLDAEQHAVNLGISCEACHNGCAEHAEQGEAQLPSFFPRSEHVYLNGADAKAVWGHNDTNANFICARCHAGERGTYANGISTWNSTEYTDAMRGSCYDPEAARKRGMQSLTCVRCHNPHRGIGQAWTNTPAEDNAECLACHEQYEDAAARTAHTHHPADSRGSDCMSCHMPRINEGMQDLVRTHTIFSPTDRKMIESNQPNACNMCHVDEPIDWTLRHLKAWYGADGYARSALAASYPERAGPAAVGWLTSPHHGTRLVGSDSLTRAGATWALSDLLGVLDDPYLINRQFTGKGIERMLGIDLRDHGYRFYMFADERAEPLKALREELIRAD